MTRSGGEASRLKKGPWTVGEDALLMEHVRRHGEGNWNAVRRETGLQRCGKSCRLRWANHLRPNLRKGPFTPEEELLILRLHALLGNKWARISSHLPGRTDNEIKNYWNTRLKRRQRAGLPLYPPEVERELGQARAHNPNALADAEDNTNANLQPPLLFDAANPLALPPMPPAATAAAAASASPLLKQNHAFHSQLQEVQQLQFNRANAPPWPLYCQDAGFGLGSYVAPGLPPLPVKVQELPSSQFATDKTSCGGGGPLEPLLHDEQPRHSPGLLRTGSMPELCREHDSKWSQSSECDGDVSSHCPQGEDLDCGGSWDFLLLDDIKPGKRRAASALEEEISYMFGIIPGSIPAEWFSNDDGGSTSPVQSSVITDDDPNLDMQQQQQRVVSPLPVSPEEHNWNP